MKENVTLLRGLSGVVYHRASFWRCLQRKKVCGFVFIIVVLYTSPHQLITKGKRSREIFIHSFSGKDVSAAAG